MLLAPQSSAPAEKAMRDEKFYNMAMGDDLARVTESHHSFRDWEICGALSDQTIVLVY
jgi:hypothetical protein